MAPWYDSHQSVPTLDGLMGSRIVFAFSSWRNSRTMPEAMAYVVA